MLDHHQLITRIDNLKAVAELLMDECDKTKKMLDGIYPAKTKKGKSKFSDEDAARLRAKIRMKFLGHV